MISDEDPQRPSGAAAPAGDRRRRIKVSELLQGEREVILEHDGRIIACASPPTAS